MMQFGGLYAIVLNLPIMKLNRLKSLNMISILCVKALNFVINY